MKLVYIGSGTLLVLGFIVAGLLVAKGPQPEIIVPAEKIFDLGPLHVTNTIISAWLVMAFLIVMGYLATRSMKLMPSGLQNFFEAVIEFLVGQAENVAGEKNGRRMFTVVATIFLFIITANWFGLLPFFNAIGSTEDVGHEIFHELSTDDPEKLKLAANGTYEKKHKFGAWKMDGSSVATVKPGTGAVDFEVEAGETPAQALDRYIVFLAKTFAGLKATEEELAHPPAEMVVQASQLLDAKADAPKLITDPALLGGHGDEEAHGVESPALRREVYGVDFEHSQKLALVVPYFRSVYSDVNNTLALGIVAFIAIEVWGFQSLGVGYLKKFFNLNGIMSFVGILELLSEFIRIISFTFRLFGNIFAGEVLVLMLTFLMPFLLVDVIYGLELFVGFIQASVFALLVLVFGSMAAESHAEDHDEGHGHAPADGEHHTGPAQAH